MWLRRSLPALALAAGLGLVLGSPPDASAGIVAEDSFLIGDTPAAGEYLAPTSRSGGQEGSPGGGDIGLVWQWAVLPGFTTTEWEGWGGEANPFGMSYPGLAGEGGMAHSTPSHHGHRFGRPLDPEFRFTGQTEGTYYLSFLLMLNQDGGTFGYRAMELHDGGFDDAMNRRFQLGVHRLHAGGESIDGDFGPGDGGWGVRVDNDDNLRFQFENQDRAQTEANLFVIRLDMSAEPGGDSVTVWMNPDPESLGGGEEPEGGRTLSGFDLTFDRISFATWENHTWLNPYLGTIFFDEIRLGTSWAAVTPRAVEAQPEGDFLEYDFTGSLEGWRELTPPNDNFGPQRWMGAAAMDARRHPGDIPLNPGAAKQYIHRDAREGGGDFAHPTLWMRSPEFRLNGAGDLTFWIMGGGANTHSNAFVPAHESEVPAQSVDTADGGFHGVVLRDAGTGDFVLTGNRTGNGLDWEKVTFPAGQLAALDQDAVYTLDAIDARHDDWSWFALDSVRIPARLHIPPTAISAIPDILAVVNTDIAPASFVLQDQEIDPALLTVSASSSNPALLPDANIQIDGTRAERTVTLLPIAGETGSATVTLTVDNGTGPADTSFELRVVRVWPPSIGDISDQDIYVNTDTGPVSFTVSSTETDPGLLSLTGSSSDATLVPDENIVFGGSGADRSVTVTPAADQTGAATITVTVSDEEVVGQSIGFSVRVFPPAIGDIPDQIIHQNTSTGPVKFSVSRLTGDPGELTLSASSSNPALVPEENILFGGSGGDRTVAVTPVADQVGEATITVTVGHGNVSGESTPFRVKVFPADVPLFEGYTDFSEFQPGGRPAGWSVWEPYPGSLAREWFVEDDPDATGGRLVSSSFEGEQMARGLLSDTARIEVPYRASVRFQENNPQGIHRGWGGFGTNWVHDVVDGEPVTSGYVVHVNRIGGPEIFSLHKLDGFNGWIDSESQGHFRDPNHPTSLGAVVLDNWDPDAWYWMELEVTETSVRARIRPDGAPEPKGWQIEVADPHPLGPGSLLLFNSQPRESNDISWDVVEVEDLTEVSPPPTISQIAGQTIFVNTSTGPLDFTVGHQEIDPGDLTVSGSSSNTTLVPDENIVFGGGGAERTVTVTPAADRTGVTTITVTVGDGERTADTALTMTVLSDDQPMEFDFDDGTLSGWTEVATDGEGRQYFAVVPPSVSSPNTTPHSGEHFIGLHIPAFSLHQPGVPNYTQDSAHDTILLRSPEFTLNGSGDLTAWLSGGGPGSPSLAGTSVDDLPSASVGGGFRGIALRNATTGMYVLSASKTSEGNAWQQVGFSAAELAALPQDHVYTLDLIDAAHDGWGWVNMDTVTIPGSLYDDSVAPEIPVLAIERSGENEVRLSWPLAASGWTLQRAPEAGGPYTDASLAVTVEGDENVAYDTIVSARQFYRLAE